MATMTFGTAVASGVNFVDSIYTRAGLSSSDFDVDYPSIKNDQVYLLKSVSNSDVLLHMPGSFFRLVPDPTVREYYDLMLVLPMGAFSNTQVVLPVVQQATDLIQSQLGISTPPSVLSDSTRKVYLTESEYEVIQAARDANKVALAPLSVQIEELRRINQQQAVLIQEYERKLIASSAS